MAADLLLLLLLFLDREWFTIGLPRDYSNRFSFRSVHKDLKLFEEREKKHEEEKIGEGYKSRQVEKFETYGEDKTLTLDKYQLKNTTSKFCESPAKTAKSDLKLSLRLTSSAYWTQVLW